MPTISAHVDDKTAATIETVAKSSPEKKVGPWLAHAAQQRLERDGYADAANVQRAELLAMAEEIGVADALDALRREFRTTPPTARPAKSKAA